jgi:2-hydroxy-3-keto-5-methylthiopentenyl-1-phosphate phosphatase
MKNTDGNSGNVRLWPAVLIDFDDTAAIQNVAELLLNRFGDPTWQQVRSRFRAGELTLLEYQEIAFRSIQADRSTMQTYVREHATLRPYFKELWGYSHSLGIPMAIVSHGLDFYIEALLEKEGIRDIPVYAVHTRFTPQISYQYCYSSPGQEHLGNSKSLIVERYQHQGYHVIYIGDGRSDFEPARQADLVFAHSTLAEECHRHQIPFRQFRDFRDVISALKEYHLSPHLLNPLPTGNQEGTRG